MRGAGILPEKWGLVEIFLGGGGGMSVFLCNFAV